MVMVMIMMVSGIGDGSSRMDGPKSSGGGGGVSGGRLSRSGDGFKDFTIWRLPAVIVGDRS